MAQRRSRKAKRDRQTFTKILAAARPPWRSPKQYNRFFFFASQAERIFADL